MSLTANRLRRGATTVAGLACILAMAGCSGGNFSAQTSQAYQPAAGAVERADGMNLVNVVAVDNDNGAFTLSAGIVNKTTQDDALTQVTATTQDGDTVDVEMPQPISLPPGQFVTVGDEPEVVLGSDGVKPGHFITMNFQFESSAPMRFKVPTVNRGDGEIYDEVAEADPPKSNSSGGNSGNKSGKSSDNNSQ